jgi:hypothetical protein
MPLKMYLHNYINLLIIPENMTKKAIKIAILLPFVSETVFITINPTNDPILKIA